MFDPAEIDEVFMYGRTDFENEALSKIQEYIDSIKGFEFGDLENEIDSYNQHIVSHKMKLQSLSEELQEMEKKNEALKTIIKNKEVTLDALKNLLISITIDEEHILALEQKSLENITDIQVSLAVLKDFQIDIDIKLTKDCRERIERALKTFQSRFLIFLKRKMNQQKSESKGELVIHKNLYEIFREYDFVVEFYKLKFKESFIILTREYLNKSKLLYDEEFEKNTNYILKALKGYKNSLNEKMEEIFKAFFDSFATIVRCECDFVAKLFFDEADFINNFLENILTDVIMIFIDFINDCNKIHSLYTINALRKNCNFQIETEIGEPKVIYLIKKNCIDNIIMFEDRYIKRLLMKWETENKIKIVETVSLDIKLCCNEEFKNRIVENVVDKIRLIENDDRKSIETCFKKKILLFIIKSTSKSDFDSATILENELSSILEKEICANLLSTELKNFKPRIKKIYEKLETKYKDYNNFIVTIKRELNYILFQNMTKEQETILNEFLSVRVTPKLENEK